jgi:hypothetical protein
MKLPRDLSGVDLARGLARYGYEIRRQTGSHVRLTSLAMGRAHHNAIPAHKFLAVGILSRIVNDVRLETREKCHGPVGQKRTTEVPSSAGGGDGGSTRGVQVPRDRGPQGRPSEMDFEGACVWHGLTSGPVSLLANAQVPENSSFSGGDPSRLQGPRAFR